MSGATDSRAFGDDVPEPKGRPLECTLCGSGSHNRGACPWGVENYRMPPATATKLADLDYAELELRILADTKTQSRPFLEELAAHLDGQEAPKPTPQLGTRPLCLEPLYVEDLKRRLAERQALYSAVDAMAQAEPPTVPSRLRRVWSALRVVLGAKP